MPPTLDTCKQLFDERFGDCEQIRLFEVVVVTMAIGGALLGGPLAFAPVVALAPAAFAAYGYRRPGIQVCPDGRCLLVGAPVLAVIRSPEEERPLEHMLPLAQKPRLWIFNSPKDLLVYVSGQVSNDIETRDDDRVTRCEVSGCCASSENSIQSGEYHITSNSPGVQSCSLALHP